MRESGWYWVTILGGNEIARWMESWGVWLMVGSVHAFSDSDFTSIGPRITPPEEK